MKVGYRKPNLKKSVKARTTGKVKRHVKKSINPTYGKKGMGIINDPKKSLYNKIYNKTTVGCNNICDNVCSESEKINIEYKTSPLSSIGNIFEYIFLIFQFIFALAKVLFGLVFVGIMIYFIFVIFF
ncbi:hypothetical protein JJB61_09930 [Clostridium perfringens]|uniref:hypothetical protein n=1 Tax=Clostridium perfringens TaxID=1502 RepID=UPI000D71C3EB|nr:hypothetical protein [Clostridium perfringens]MBO3385350.1 hypothetical protein [Clostridium perfringens]MBO3397288.1 hypothetical protein [Clostridium perfringens]PWX33306.1 hypothetical protein CYK93_00030 [Clostridium perfringens]PWX59934.1 hypothetical protein CYK86_00030 [Clostridium perfringens]